MAVFLAVGPGLPPVIFQLLGLLVELFPRVPRPKPSNCSSCALIAAAWHLAWLSVSAPSWRSPGLTSRHACRGNVQRVHLLRAIGIFKPRSGQHPLGSGSMLMAGLASKAASAQALMPFFRLFLGDTSCANLLDLLVFAFCF